MKYEFIDQTFPKSTFGASHHPLDAPSSKTGEAMDIVIQPGPVLAHPHQVRLEPSQASSLFPQTMGPVQDRKAG